MELLQRPKCMPLSPRPCKSRGVRLTSKSQLTVSYFSETVSSRVEVRRWTGIVAEHADYIIRIVPDYDFVLPKDNENGLNEVFISERRADCARPKRKTAKTDRTKSKSCHVGVRLCDCKDSLLSNPIS
jgi:hypothetical protein